MAHHLFAAPKGKRQAISHQQLASKRRRSDDGLKEGVTRRDTWLHQKMSLQLNQLKSEKDDLEKSWKSLLQSRNGIARKNHSLMQQVDYLYGENKGLRETLVDAKREGKDLEKKLEVVNEFNAALQYLSREKDQIIFQLQEKKTLLEKTNLSLFKELKMLDAARCKQVEEMESCKKRLKEQNKMLLEKKVRRDGGVDCLRQEHAKFAQRVDEVLRSHFDIGLGDASTTTLVASAAEERGSAMSTLTEASPAGSGEEDPDRSLAALALPLEERAATVGLVPSRSSQLAAPSDHSWTHRTMKFLKELGRGTYGAVTLVEDKHTTQQFAIKVAPIMAWHDARLEAEMMKAVGDHPNIVRLHERTVADGKAVLLLEHCKGGTVEGWVKNMGVSSERNVGKAIFAVAGALAFMHSKGVVHVDLKPDNVFFSQSPPQPWETLNMTSVKVGDFGLAEYAGLPGSIGYDAHYMPPESIRGERTGSPSHDMWSLGLLMFYLFTREYPYETSADVLRDSRPDFPLSRFINRRAVELLDSLMNKDPTLRPTAAEVLQHPWLKSCVQ